MGTFVEIKTYSDSSDIKKVVGGAITLAGGLEKRFSAFDPASEINRLNSRREGKVSPDLYEVLGVSGNTSRLTGGKFDITVSPVLKKKGFYASMPAVLKDRIPDSYADGDWKKVVLAGNSEVVLGGDVWVDLSGIAKGYIVDRMAMFLENGGVGRFLINAGGDIFCGAGPDGRKWQIGLREPGSGKVLLVIAVCRMAVATSGDYENWVFDEIPGRDVAHIVDPSASAPIDKKMSSVTVIAPVCARADALATGMMAMGSKKAIDLAETIDGVEVITVDRDGEGYKMGYSSGAKEYVK